MIRKIKQMGRRFLKVGKRPSASIRPGSALTKTQFEAIFECAPLGMGLIEKELGFTEVNTALCRLLGYRKADLVGKHLSQFLHPDHRDLGQNLENQLRQESLISFSSDVRLIAKSGESLWIHLSLASTPASANMRQSAVATALDISNRKRAEEERDRAIEDVRQSQLFLDSVIENIPNMIFIKEAEELRFVRFNRAGEELLGFARDGLLGKNDYDFFPKEQADFFVAKDREVLNGDSVFDIPEEEIQTAAKGKRILHTKKLPLLGPDGRSKFLLGISEDITEKKAAQEELIRARESALQASQMKSEFLANMSHEIRTPINGVIGMTDLLLETSLMPDQKDCAETIRSSAETLLTVINDILDFSKVEAGRIELDLVGFNLSQLVEEVAKSFQYSADKKDIRLSVVSDVAPGLALVADPGRLRQILNNLLSNALKFTEAGHVTLTVRANEIGKKVELYCEVEDSGVGISQVAQGKLFQAFSQADSSTTRRFGGTGLGLSISKKLVELMNGKIGLQSLLGRGSKFWFQLSLDRADNVEVGVDEPLRNDLNAADAARFRILVVEDNSVNQKVALKMLERLGFRALAVANGFEALDSLRKFRFDLILMDCQMPDLDGYQTTQTIRSQGTLRAREIPIVAMTANAIKGDREKCLDAGMNDYLPKPIQLNQLSRILGRWLRVKPPADSTSSVIAQSVHRAASSEVLESLRQFDSSGSNHLIVEVIELFLTSTGDIAIEIEKAFARSDFTALSRLGHTLKSSSASLGASRLSGVCAELEAQAKSGAPEKVGEVVARFRNEWGAAKDELTQELHKQQANQKKAA